MNALARLLQGTGGKIAVAALIALLVIGAVCWIFWPTVSGWWNVEPPTTNLGSALARTKSAAPKAAPHPNFTKRAGKPVEDAPRLTPAGDGPQQGQGDPKHVYEIAPFAQPSTIRAHVPSSCSETDARTTALRLSTNLVREADRFTVWFLEDEAFLDNWAGGADLEADAAKHALWRVDTSRAGDGAFQVDTLRNLRDPPGEPRR